MAYFYRCLPTQDFREGEYHLRPLDLQDMEPVRQWRNEQIDILRQQAPLTKEEQVGYWNTVIIPSFSQSRPEQLLFAYLKEEDLIGYGGITHIDWDKREGELSFLLDPAYTTDPSSYRSRFGTFLQLIKRIAFEQIKLSRVFTETYDVRPDHVAELESKGFLFERRLDQHVELHGRLVDSLIHGCISNET
jgi:RimJ/RimL family protein N-acetyltransferase